MPWRWALPALFVLSLPTGLTTEARAQTALPSAPPRTALSSAGIDPFATQPAGQSVVLAQPFFEPPPSFLNDLDTHFMADEMVDKIEDRYYMKLRDFSLKQGYMLHTRDSRLQRNLPGSPAEEQAVRQEMARSMRQYMIFRGLPKYLSSKKETRFLGESYTQAVNLAQTVGRIEIKSKDESWKFSSGINPFTTKAWAKYSSPSSTLELYNIFNRKDSLGLVASTTQGRYVPMAQYLILRNALETGVKVKFSPMLESELKTQFPFEKPDVLEHCVTKIATSYRF